MNDFIKTILIMSLSGSIIAVILFALTPLVRNRLPKSTQYYLWLVVVAALLVPVSSFMKLPTVTESVPIIMSPSSVVERYIITPPKEEITHSNSSGPLNSEANQDQEVTQTVEQTQSPMAVAVNIFKLVYPLGVLIVLLYYCISYIVFSKLYRRHNSEAQTGELNLLTELCGNRRIPQIYRNPLATTPMLIGVFRQSIILPSRLYTDAQLRAVLVHELIHLRRKDIFIKWLSLLINAVHWFNPIVWLVRREIDRSCELSCDEAVIRNLDRNGKQNYGETLIYVAADSKKTKGFFSTTMCEEKKVLKERLGAIMKSRKHTRKAAVLSVVLLLATILTACVLGAGSDSSNEDIDTKSPDQTQTPPNTAEVHELSVEDIMRMPISEIEEMHSTLSNKDVEGLSASEKYNATLTDYCLTSLKSEESKNNTLTDSFLHEYNYNYDGTMALGTSNYIQYPLEQEIEVDLNGDGNADKIIVSTIKGGSNDGVKVTINNLEWNSAEYHFGYLMDEFAIVDIDERDVYKEIVISDYGPSTDHSSIFLSYDGEKIIYMNGGASANLPSPKGVEILDNYISGLYTYMACAGNGEIITSQRAKTLQTWKYPLKYILTDGHMLQAVVPELINVNYKVFVLKDLPLYTERNEASPTLTMPRGTVVTISALDDIEWIQITLADGQSGWFKVKDHNKIVTDDREILATDIFFGLSYFD